MSTRAVIFISAVSKELHSARDVVAKTLLALGYDPKWQDIAPTETGDLRGVLRNWVDDSDAVLQLVGHCYGFAPKHADADFGPCSYTQYEALYARHQGKPVYYIFTDDAHPIDGCGCESQTLHDLQEKYRKTVKAYGALYHSTSSLTQTELLVRRLKDDLTHLRKRHRRHAALVLSLLIVIVIGGSLLMRGQQHTDETVGKQTLVLMRGQQHTDEIVTLALADLRQILESSIKGGSEQKLTADYDAALRFIAHKRGISLDFFRAFLDKNATHALSDTTVSSKDRVRALQEAGQFVRSRDFAVEQARRLEHERQKNSKEEVELWTEAAKTELTLGHYDSGVEYATKAVNEAHRQSDFPTWSAARHQQGRALSYVRKDQESQALHEELIRLQRAAFGPDHLAVLQSRRLLAVTIEDQGNYILAEQQDRALVADCLRMLGADHPETLASRNNLSNVLQLLGKHVEAEREQRAVLKVRERVLGAEHPNTLGSRNNLSNVLQLQGKHIEAEQEQRAVLLIQERVLGSEHPDTLGSRMNLANALATQGKSAEAEKELRVVLKLHERVLGAEHPATLMTRMNLANALQAQGKNIEADHEQRAVLEIKESVLGAEHPDTLMSRNNLANSMDAQGRYAEAEQEHRVVLQVRERVLGASHPDTLASRMNVANTLRGQRKDAEAENEYREVFQNQERLLGAEHPETLMSRNNLAIALNAQGKHAEAEQEDRAVLTIKERVLGAEHAEVAGTCHNLALCLKAQQKLPEALNYMQRAAQVRTKVLGPEHPDTKRATTWCERLEAELKRE